MTFRERDITAADGRNLRVLEAGEPDGIPLLIHGGTPNSRLLYRAWIEDANASGLRLISYDRPGYGGSTPRPNRTVADCAQDVAAIARALGVNRLLIWGISGGAPHALACAALLPDLVVAAAALASPAPYPADGLDFFAGMGESNVREIKETLKGREFCARSAEILAAQLLAADPQSFVKAFSSLLCQTDLAAFSTEFGEFVLRKIRAGIEKTRDGWVDDDLAFLKPWGFDFSQIRVPVLLVHGGQDRMVPISHATWLAARIPNVEARLLPDDGHLTLSTRRIPEVHAWLLGKR